MATDQNAPAVVTTVCLAVQGPTNIVAPCRWCFCWEVVAAPYQGLDWAVPRFCISGSRDLCVCLLDNAECLHALAAFLPLIRDPDTPASGTAKVL